MTFIRRLFGGKPSQVEEIAERVRSNVRAVYGPLSDLSKSIIEAADTSHKTVSRAFGISVTGTPSQESIFLLYEFIYFFCHMTMRAAVANGLTRQQVQKVQGFLGPLLALVSIDTFFQHWPDHLKVGMRNEFFEKLNDTEGEYAVCTALASTENPSSPDTLFGKLCCNVGMLLGRQVDLEFVSVILPIAMEAFLGIGLDNCMKSVASVIDAVRLEEIPWDEVSA